MARKDVIYWALKYDYVGQATSEVKENLFNLCQISDDVILLNEQTFNGNKEYYYWRFNAIISKITSNKFKYDRLGNVIGVDKSIDTQQATMALILNLSRDETLEENDKQLLRALIIKITTL